MNDRPDRGDLPDLPPHPLPDDARQRVRGRLRAIADQAPERRTGWIVPVVAAAVLVAGAVTGVALVTDGDGDAGPAAPAGQSGAPSVTPSPGPSEQTGRPVLPDVAPKVCDDEVEHYLDDPGKIGAIVFDEGLTSVYDDGRRSIVCDQWAQKSGDDTVTVLQKNARVPELSRDLFRLSMNFNGKQGEYVAGGVLPEGVTEISYAFPGEEPVVADRTETVWAMHFLSTDKPWDGSARLPTDPTVVTVTMEDGTTEQYSLDPMAIGDFCAQLNHGC